MIYILPSACPGYHRRACILAVEQAQGAREPGKAHVVERASTLMGLPAGVSTHDVQQRASMWPGEAEPAGALLHWRDSGTWPWGCFVNG